MHDAVSQHVALLAVEHALARRLERHWAWALRLCALATGSWLYRMEYGVWLLLTDGAGHTRDFRGLVDQVIAFGFYVPNLLVVEVVLRTRRIPAHPAVQLVAAGVLASATGVLLLGTYFFTRFIWGPAIPHRLIG